VSPLLQKQKTTEMSNNWENEKEAYII
jgi:hypothetical protein